MDTVKVVVIAADEASAGQLQAGLDGGSDGAVAVVGSAVDTRSAVELVRRARPTVTIVDVSGSDQQAKSALATIREVARMALPTRILALSDSADAEPAVEALTAGASGVLVRPADSGDLAAPVLALAFGHSVLHRPLLAALVGSATPREAERDAEIFDTLNAQYMDLWRMVADGLETVQIAERLYVSERTAKRLVASLLRRLKVANRIQAAALAGQAGLLDDMPATAPGA